MKEGYCDKGLEYLLLQYMLALLIALHIKISIYLTIGIDHNILIEQILKIAIWDLCDDRLFALKGRNKIPP